MIDSPVCVLHYYPREKWMNDPNGLVYFQGEYHLFYQYNPEAMVWGPMHWGHAVSNDMVRWEHLSIALYPDELGTIFSGSIVVDWKNTSGFFKDAPGLVAVFTHHGADGQRQSIAWSKDRGRTWVKYEGNPVLERPGYKDFRDPKVFWFEPQCKWIMILACGDRAGIYASLDLKAWEHLCDFGPITGLGDGVWECPDLFQLPVSDNTGNMKWVLKVDISDGAVAGGSGGVYFIGKFDGGSFTLEEGQSFHWIDYGKDFYAAQSFSDIPEADGRRIWIAWMNNWKYANLIPAENHRGTMSIPRKLALRNSAIDGIKLVQTPVEELASYRTSIYQESGFVLMPGECRILENVCSDTTEIIVEFGSGTDSRLVMEVRRGEEEKIIIGYSALNSELSVDRTLSGRTEFSPDYAEVHKAMLESVDNKVKLHIVLGRCSVEVFGNDGEVVITDLIFPCEESRGFMIYSIEELVTIDYLSVYKLSEKAGSL